MLLESAKFVGWLGLFSKILRYAALLHPELLLQQKFQNFTLVGSRTTIQGKLQIIYLVRTLTFMA